MKKVLIIANKKAGKGEIVKYIDTITKNLRDLGYVVNVVFTQLNSDIDIGKCYDKIIVCGGDGTLNQVVGQLCKEKIQVPVGYIPFGTMNDFSKSLGVSKNPYDISKNIDNYVEKKFDIGKFNDRFFSYVVSLGIFSKTSYSTSTKLKNRFGRLAYMFFGVKELFKYDKYHLKISYDDSIIDDEFIYGSISNSKYIGGFSIFKHENINLSDGKFEGLFVKKTRNVFETLKIALKVLTGHLNDKNICYFRTSNVKIKAESETEWSIDGENSGKIRNIEISNLNENIIYLIPEGGKENE